MARYDARKDRYRKSLHEAEFPRTVERVIKFLTIGERFYSLFVENTRRGQVMPLNRRRLIDQKARFGARFPKRPLA